MIKNRTLPLFVLIVSMAALAFALIAQYGFGLRPCVLCLTQRVPFVIAGLLAALALMPACSARLQRVALTLAALAFLVNSGIAVYHVGVEQKWWMSQCAAAEPAAFDVKDLSALMSKPAEARCDEPAWEWNGITMAAMNIVFSCALGLIVLAGLYGRKERG